MRSFLGLGFLLLVLGCGSPGPGGTGGAGGSGGSTQGTAGQQSSGGSAGASDTCFSASDNHTYASGEKGCRDLFNTGICDTGSWTSTHFCDGADCQCDHGSCMGSDCL